MKIWTNEKALIQLYTLRMQAVACGNQSYAKVLSAAITRIEIDIESAELFGA